MHRYPIALRQRLELHTIATADLLGPEVRDAVPALENFGFRVLAEMPTGLETWTPRVITRGAQPLGPRQKEVQKNLAPNFFLPHKGPTTFGRRTGTFLGSLVVVSKS